MKFGLLNHQVLHFKDENAQQLRTIMFTDSLGTAFRFWDEVVLRFGEGFRVLRYDLRGHGLRSLSKLVPNAGFEIVPDAGHLPCFEQPDILAARIAAFGRETLSA